MIKDLKLTLLIVLIAFASSQTTPTQYATLAAANLQANIIKVGYSPNQQLIVALVQSS